MRYKLVKYYDCIRMTLIDYRKHEDLFVIGIKASGEVEPDLALQSGESGLP